MAIFRNPKLDQLEDVFLVGKTFGEGDSMFTLTLFKVIPSPSRIMDYRWVVRLADGYEFETYMGEELLSLPYTRLNDIQKKIAEHSSTLNSEQMSEEINCTIQAVLVEHK